MTDAVAPEASEARPRRRRAPAPGERASWRFAELLGLAGLAFAQPLLDIYGKNPLELISRQVEGFAIVAFAVLVVLVPPVTLFLVEQVVGLVSPVARRRLHPILLAVLAGLFVVQLVPSGAVLGVVAIALGVAVAVGVWYGFARLPAVRQWLRFLAVAPILFAALFLSIGAVASLAFQSPPAPAAIEAGPDAPSIVVVVLDELPTRSLLDREGAIDAARFPHLAELASDATWYPNNVTIGSWTSLAVPGILTGQYPQSAGNRAHWSEYPENLFTLVGGSYDVVAHESSTRLCPDAVCPESARPRVEAVADISTSAAALWAGLVNPFGDVELAFEPAGATVDQKATHQLALDAVDQIVADDDPTLAYLHLSLPHQPWRMLESGQTTDAPNPAHGMVNNRWVDDMAASSARQRHLLQLEFADTVVGDVVDGLQEAGRFDDTMIVVVGDHGVSFRGGQDQRAISEATLPDIAFTPLLIKAPGQAGGVVDERPVQTVDIVPTIADLAGIELPWAVDGTSLVGDADLAGRTRRYFPVWIDELVAGPDGYATLDDQPLAARLDAIEPEGSLAAMDQLGRDLGLTGRRVEDLRVVDGPGVATVHGGRAFEDLDLGADELPLYVDIEVDAGVEGELAVAIDGTVAVTGALGGQGNRHLWAVVPPDRVRDGANRIEVFRVGGTPEQPELARLTTNAT